ncbi:hypothetical protein LTR84_010948 [Exophiala bonariae]|uniref:F-box domain-containing protein n=1 Tax=Exophiala bonariae TaxID=1690606 RepID=A0AAV9NLH5_9EURO|nr:hypothetical protein LTR84_010948 [Exophiala bonariae]
MSTTAVVPTAELHKTVEEPKPLVEPTLLDLLMGLPEEVLNVIYSFLDIVSLERFSRSSKTFNDMTAAFMFQKIHVMDFTMIYRIRVPDWKCKLLLQEMSECSRLRYTTEVLYLPQEIAASPRYFSLFRKCVPNLTYLCTSGMRLRLTQSTVLVLQLPGLGVDEKPMDAINQLAILLTHMPKVRTVELPHPMSANLYPEPLTTEGDFETEAAAQRTHFQGRAARILSTKYRHIQHVGVQQVIYPEDLHDVKPVVSYRLTPPPPKIPTPPRPDPAPVLDHQIVDDRDEMMRQFRLQQVSAWDHPPNQRRRQFIRREHVD